MVLVMDTFGLQLCMPLIVAMPMESLKVCKCIPTSQAEREDVIYFYHIPILEIQSTVSASPFVVFQQLSKRTVRHRVIFEPLCPVDKISIVGACCSSNFDVALDGRTRVSPEGHLFRPKCPSFSWFSTQYLLTIHAIFLFGCRRLAHRRSLL